MDRDTIRRMDPELYQEKLEDAVMDDVACILNVNKGHSSVLHAGQSMNDMISRLIREEKQAVSSFYNSDSLIENLQDAVYFQARNISDWISSNRIDYDNLKNYQEIAFSMHMADESIGQGVLKNGKIMESSEMIIVLQRDISGESPFGFFVKTAYVDVQNEKSVEIGKIDLNKFIQKDMHFDSDIQRTYFTIRNKYPSENIQLKTRNGQEFIQIAKSIDNGKIIAYIDKDSFVIKKYEDNKCQKISLGKCILDHPEMANIITDVKNQSNIYEQEIYKSKEDVLH